MRDLVSQLNRVGWHIEGSHAPNISELGIEHCFGGVAETAPQDLCYLKQVHGKDVVAIEPCTRGEIEGDGVWSQSSGVALGVQTADCLPIFFVAGLGTAVMAVHAGWRGVGKGIIVEAIDTLQAAGYSPKECRVAIGPSIGISHFEVGYEVVEAIGQSCNGLSEIQLAMCLVKGKKDRWHVDLQMVAVATLINREVDPKNISVIRACTYEGKGIWHSYRRDGAKCGRNWSWLRLPSNDSACPGKP